MENYEKTTLENLFDYYQGLDWIELPENIREFWQDKPQITIVEHGATLNLWNDERELIIGFGSYGGVGEIWDGLLLFQFTDHNETAKFYELDGEVSNGSPFYVWDKVFAKLTDHIGNGGKK